MQKATIRYYNIWLAIAFTLTLMCSCKSDTQQTQSQTFQLKAQYKPATDTLKLSLKNNSKKEAEIFDFTYQKNNLPDFITIQIIDNNNKILTKNNISSDGFWSFNFLQNQLIQTPVTIKTLPSGQQIKIEYKASHLLLGISNLKEPLQLSEIHGRFRCKLRIFTNKMLTESIEVKTDWIKLK